MSKTNIAVYGTLRPGHLAHKNFGLDAAPLVIGGVRLPGTMYDLGSFPGIKLDDGSENTFVADIYEVDDATMERLDYYEGAPHMYRRRELLFGGHKVVVYEYNGAVEPRIRVESGDWLDGKAA